MLSEGWDFLCQSDVDVLKLLGFKNHSIIIALELHDFYVIVIEVIEPCSRVFDNCSRKRLSVKAFGVAWGFRELELSWDRGDRLERNGSKVDVT